MKHIVYKTTNKINNKIYIGIHSTDNIDDGYLGSGTIFKRALNKYGVSNFEREILYIYDTREEAFNKERDLVNKEFVLDESNYNMILGGRGCIAAIKVEHTRMLNRVKEIGLKGWDDFVNKLYEFSVYNVIISQENNEDVNLFSYDMAKYIMGQEQFELNRNKLINYKKQRKEIIRAFQYVAYGY